MIILDLNKLLDHTHEHASFHDAAIYSVYIDYVNHKAKLECELFIDDPDGPRIEDPTRKGILYLDGLLYFVIDPPSPEMSFEEAEGLDISSDGPVEGTKFKSLIPKLPELSKEDAETAFVHCLYVSTWNSFIFFAAKAARFEWLP